ncbi:MAG: cell division protein FtsA [Actinobacteria bacterium]|nr:cell division protein FtsA [Actinomycetota bacterium]
MSSFNEYITGIDIGTTKVTTLIGGRDRENSFKIAGYGISDCSGIKKGIVIDINEATRSILKSVEDAEKSSKIFVENAYIGVTGKHISFLNNWSEIKINSPNNIIRKMDIDKLISQANRINLPPQYQVIHTLIKQFVIDDEPGILDPAGLSANKLAVELLAIYGSASLIRNVLNSMKAAKIEVEDIILEALASAEAVLLPEEKESGIILLDIGGGTTDVAVYKDNKMVFTYCLPVGGNLITNDISIGLNIAFRKAEEIKKKFANVDYNFYENLSRINLEEIQINRDKTTLNIRLYNIVNSRTRELLNLIKDKIDESGFLNLAPCGVVITGGSSQLKGILPLAETIFGLPARLGLPTEIEGPSEVVSDPIYSTGVGLLKYAQQAENYGDTGRGEGKSKKNAGIIGGFRDFILKILRSFK